MQQKRKQKFDFVEKVVISDNPPENLPQVEIVDEYRKLNDKCDLVITKIKSRKQKKTK